MKNKFGTSIVIAALSATLPAVAQDASQQNQAQPNQAVQTQTPATDQSGGARARNSDFSGTQNAGNDQGTAPDQSGGARARNSDATSNPVNDQRSQIDVANQGQWRSPGAMAKMGKLERADKVLGREVVDSQNQKIGNVKDFAVDLKNGRIVEAIIGTGGVLGVDEKYYAVPPQALTCNEEQKTIQLNVDQNKFNSAPAFNLSDWGANASQDKVAEVYQYYGSQPFWTTEGQTAHQEKKEARETQMGQLVRADKLMGSTVENMQDQRLGKVHDLIISLKNARVAEVVLASGGFLGMNDEFSAGPPQAFREDNNSDVIRLDTSKDVLANAPHFNSSSWPDFNNPDQVVAVYRTYDIQPYFGTTGAAGTYNARTGQDELNAASQGTSKNDVVITRNIRQDIMADKDLSMEAKNIIIITQHGQVTLKGTVNSQDEKQRLANMAAKEATAGSVINEVQVTTTTSSLK